MRRNIYKIIAFIVLFSVILSYFTIRYIPKYFYRDSVYATTSTELGFYQLPNNSIDVLFLGSSAGACAFAPQVLYDDYGYTSYNLSFEQQNMANSYFWLKEALRYQKPKVLVLESKFLFTQDSDKITDVWFRKALNHMKMSSVKIKSIYEVMDLLNEQAVISGNVNEQSVLSYLFPIIRFHTRWKEENEMDSLSYYMSNAIHSELLGYNMFVEHSDDDYNAIDINNNSGTDVSDFAPVELRYVDKIVSLCRENNIELIMTLAPCVDDSIGRYNALMTYADSKNVKFIDFNSSEAIKNMGFSFETDPYDGLHCNVYGARKITDYIGDYIDNNYGLSKHDEKYWDNTRNVFQNVLKDKELNKITNLNEYLDTLYENIDRYVVFISLSDEGTSCLSDETLAKLRRLGLNADLRGRYRYSYIAIIDSDYIEEHLDEVGCSYAKTDSHDLKYEITSGGFTSGDESSIFINGSEYSKQSRGLNFAIFEKNSLSVIDSVAFDTYEVDNACSR